MAIDRRTKGILLVLIAAPIAVLAFAFGHIVEGLDNPDTQCAYDSQKPPIPIEVHGESGMRENGGWSLLPLGLACEFEEPGDGIPPQTVIVANWPATTIWLSTSAAVAFGIVQMAGPERWFRRPQDA